MTEVLEKILLRIYHFDASDLVGWGLLAALAVSAVCRRCAGRRWFRRGLWLGLVLWMAAVLWITLFRRSGGGSHEPCWIPLYTYWKVLGGGNSELLRSCWMNVALFFPAGLLCGALTGKRRRLGLTATAALLLSLTIELVQYRFGLGLAEMDDVLHNTLGAALGYGASRLELIRTPAEKEA